MKRSIRNKSITFATKKGYVVNKKGELFYKDKKRLCACDGNGYFTFSIKLGIKNNNYIYGNVAIHRLQAYQKFGKKIFEKGIQVRHLNGNCKDNCYDNIVLGSPSQNSMDRSIDVRKSMAIHASKAIRRFDDRMINKLNEDRKTGMSYKKLGLKYKIGKGTLSYFFNKALYNKK